MTREGFWGERTATIDWCEANYEVTHYIAEFWNTLSNLIMILFPLYALYWSYIHIKHANNLKKKSPHKWKIYFKIPTSIILCHLALLLVGLGSWSFHMTLLYPMQLLDEIPMLFCSAVLIYSNYDLILSRREFDAKQAKKVLSNDTALKKFLSSRFTVASTIITFTVTVTIVYLFFLKSPLFFQTAYGFMVIVIVSECLAVLTLFKSSKRMILTSGAYYVIGFIFWNLDNNFCEYLTLYKTQVENFFGLDPSLPDLKAKAFNVIIFCLKSIFEFHSLWHLFVGFGSYFSILCVIEGNYQLHLNKTKELQKNEKKVIDLKYSNLYYHLTNELIQTKRDV